MEYQEILDDLDVLRNKLVNLIERDKGKLLKEVKKDGKFYVDDIMNAVCNSTFLSEEDISSSSRVRSTTQARQVFCYLAWRNTNLSLVEIGRIINRKYTTVIHARDSVKCEVEMFKTQGFDPIGTVSVLKDIQRLYGINY
jgi:chromosomal replication initiation ATPase DnaA